MRPLSALSDEELIRRLGELALAERRSLADFLEHLGEMDSRIAARRTPWPCLFDYLTKELGFAEDDAFKRITAARAAADFPQICGYIRSGKLSLSGILKLGPSLKGPDAVATIERAAGKSVREIAAMVAPVLAGTPAPAKIRPVKRRVTETTGPLFEAAGEVPRVVENDQFSFEAPRELKDLLERSRDLLWHKIPFGQPEAVFIEWGREWLERHDPLRREPPRRASTKKAGRDRPPAWARHAVWKRDAGRCAFKAADGRRCEARRGLELDHVRPRSLGGSHDPANLRLLCRAHNDAERRRIVGEGDPSPRAA